MCTPGAHCMTPRPPSCSSVFLRFRGSGKSVLVAVRCRPCGWTSIRRNSTAMVNRQNANTPKGQITDGATSADITTNDQLLKATDYMPLVVGYHNGAAIKLSDVAQVQDSTENVRAAGFVNGKPCVLIFIFRQPGANIIETVD